MKLAERPDTLLVPKLSAAARALAIPEVLLEVLSRGVMNGSHNRRLLARWARVNSTWTAPVQSELYRDITLTWSFTAATSLFRATDANPALCGLVKSLTVTGYDNEADLKKIVEPQDWNELTGHGWGLEEPAARVEGDVPEGSAVDERLVKLEGMDVTRENSLWLKRNTFEGPDESSSRLLDLLERLPNLRHLHLSRLNLTPSRPPPLSFVLVNNLQRLSSITLTIGEKPGMEQIICSASHNIQSLEVHQPPPEFNFPPLQNLRHLLILPALAYWNVTPSTPLTEVGSNLETLILLRQAISPPELVFPRLSHLHVTPSFNRTLPPLFFEGIQQLQYLSIYLDLSDGVTVNNFRHLANILPAKVHTLDASVKIYEYELHGRDPVSPEFYARRLLALIEGSPENVKRVCLTSMLEEADLVEVRRVAEARGIELELWYDDFEEDQVWRRDQCQRMMDDWRSQTSRANQRLISAYVLVALVNAVQIDTYSDKPALDECWVNARQTSRGYQGMENRQFFE